MALRETLRVALATRGGPAQCYVDNGSMFIDAGLRRACAIRGSSSPTPNRPAPGRGKIQRCFKTVGGQFLVEITDGAEGTGSPVSSLAELNALFTAWVDRYPTPGCTRNPGWRRWPGSWPPAHPRRPGRAAARGVSVGESRTVTKTATVSLHGNLYEVDPALAGARVELVFDPFDLTTSTCATTVGRPGGRCRSRWAPRPPKAHTDAQPRRPRPASTTYA